jgi:hypothetical protein
MSQWFRVDGAAERITVDRCCGYDAAAVETMRDDGAAAWFRVAVMALFGCGAEMAGMPGSNLRQCSAMQCQVASVVLGW